MQLLIGGGAAGTTLLSADYCQNDRRWPWGDPGGEGRWALAEAPMARGRVFAAILIAVALGVAAVVALVWKPRIDPVKQDQAQTFDPTTVTRGSELAALGNCVVCHTASGGKSYAGGRPIPTPFGTIYSTNITPDRDTGIGEWSEAAFRRALRVGVDRAGEHLYPAFPYDHFTRLTDGDIRALYAFVMTRRAVRNQPPPNELPFPFNIRPLLAGWKLLYLRKGPVEADTKQSADWNRGAYLVEGIAHCGACHTPRNALGAEEKSRAYAGGDGEGWDAPALDASSPAPVPWTADALFAYLRSGWQHQHGASAGPMEPVTRNLATVSEADVRAIAVYVAGLSRDRNTIAPPTPGKPDPAQADTSRSTSAAIYAGACAVCHDKPAGAASEATSLTLSSSLRLQRPRNALNAIVHGIARPLGASGPFMPAFGTTLTDQQIADLTNYIRTRFGGAAAWGDVQGDLQKIRNGDPS